MSELIDKLIENERYNIYENRNISDANLKRLALLLENEKNNRATYFNLFRYKSKHCWVNILKVIGKMNYKKRVEYISYLLTFLQDANWPVFKHTIPFLMTYKNKDLIPIIEKTLWKAYKEDDDMWIAGLAILIEDMGLEQSDFEVEETYGLLEYRNF
jgi:hypothetical protein